MSDLQQKIRDLRARVIALSTDNRRRFDAKHAVTDALTACEFAERRLQDAEKIMGVEVLEGSAELTPEGGVTVREPQVVPEEAQRLTIEWL
jgi:hypothetical protein